MPKKKRRKTTRQEAQRAEFGICDLIADASITYRQAAKKWNVKMFMLRSRVEYRFGSLAEARALNGAIHLPEDGPEATRKRACMVCRKVYQMPKSRYICDKCTAQNQNIFEGVV